MRTYFKKIFAAASALVLTLSVMPALPQNTSASDMPDFSFLGAVGTLTEEQTIGVAEAIYEGLAAHSDFADFSGKKIDSIAPTTENIDSLMDVFVTVIGGWDVGILANKNDTNCLLRSAGGGEYYVVGMAIYYMADDDEYDVIYADLMAQLDAITAGVDPSWSAPEKALYLHEYMTIHYDYDYDALNSTLTSSEDMLCYTAYGMMKNGKAVCEGYTWLYSILLRRVGIQSLAVRSWTLNHAWNLLYIDGSWYHVDVTWDDVYDTHPGYSRHNSFLKDSDAMKESKHTSSDWVLTTGKPVTELPVSDKYNDCFWSTVNSVIEPYQNGWLAIQSDYTYGSFNLYSFDAETGEAEYETLAYLDEKWLLWGESSRYYVGCFSAPSVNYGTIYYSLPTSLVAFRNGVHVPFYELPEDQQAIGYIYGIYTEEDTLYYSVSQQPYERNGKIFSIDLTEYRDMIYDEAGWPEETTTPPVPTYPMGDADGDGSVTLQDAVLLYRWIHGTTELDSEQLERLDILPDDCVDIFDLAMLKRLLLDMT